MKTLSRNRVRGNSKRLNFLLCALCAMLLAFCASANAQPGAKIFRIGYLDASAESGSAVLLDPLRKELNKLGWTEGKNIAFEYRFGEGKAERQDQLASELVGLKVDLIVVAGQAAALAAKRATTSIPVVMASAGDPLGGGLVDNLARPGGNVTGFSALATDLNTKRLEILNDAVPKLNRVGVLFGPERRSAENLRAAAQALKINLEEIQTRAEVKALENAFQIAKERQVGAIMTTAQRSFVGERKRIVELAGKHRLPAIHTHRAFIEVGGMMSYGVDYLDLYRRTAVYVDKILRGAKPADLPVQQATKFEFVINLKAAKEIGLTIPPSVLAKADRVIK
jgi:putative ABC transport system substrate-binding protein